MCCTTHMRCIVCAGNFEIENSKITSTLHSFRIQFASLTPRTLWNSSSFASNSVIFLFFLIYLQSVRSRQLKLSARVRMHIDFLMFFCCFHLFLFCWSMSAKCVDNAQSENANGVARVALCNNQNVPFTVPLIHSFLAIQIQPHLKWNRN